MHACGNTLAPYFFTINGILIARKATCLPSAKWGTFGAPVVAETSFWCCLTLTALKQLQKHNDCDFDCYSSFTIFSRTECFSHSHKAGNCGAFL